MSDPQDRAEALDDDKMAVTDTPVDDLEYPPDQPTAVEDYGTTAAEEQVDEPLEERITREVPEGAPVDEPTGRLVEPGEDEIGAADDEADAVAREVPAADLTAEEAAVHDTAEPPMDGDDGYVDEAPPVSGNDIRP
jgi:hypothetical protein